MDSCFLGGANSSVDTHLQNGVAHNGTNYVSQSQSNSTKNSHRKSLDKGEKEDQYNKTSASIGSHVDKKYSHTNGTTISSTDLQFVEKIGYDIVLFKKKTDIGLINLY